MIWNELHMTKLEWIINYLKTTDNWHKMQVQDFDTHEFGDIIVCSLDNSVALKVKPLCDSNDNIFVEPFGKLHLDYSTVLCTYYLESNPNNIKHMSSLI